MNIRFNNIFSDAIDNLKQNSQKLIVNSLIFSILTSFLAFVLIAILGAAIVAMMAAINSNATAALFPFIVLLVTGFIISIPIMFIDVVGIYAVAKSSSTNMSLGQVLKSVVTKGNVWTFIKMVAFPSFVATLIFLIVCLLSAILGMALFVITLLIGSLLIIVLNYYLTAPFHLAMYIDPVVKNNAKSLITTYGRTTLFNAYLVQVGLIILISFVTGPLSVIPVLGVFIANFATYVLGGAVVQAMIGAVNNKPVQEVKSERSEVTIVNDQIKLTIASHGAEIRSLIAGDKEYMWQADSAYWGRTSPVLFPFVGKLKDDRYEQNGDLYQMSQHGFLRDRDFTIKAEAENQVTFMYTSTLVDYDLYPFDFTVEITYTIDGSKVTTSYNVINNGTEEMIYQIGAHPAFNINSVDDIQTVYPKQTVTKHFFENGLQAKTTEVEIEVEQLSYEGINVNIPCYSNFSDKQLTLVENGRNYLKFDFSSMEYLAIWSPEFKNAKFICVEPWNGICSRQDQIDYKLENKEGMNTLAANSAKECSYSFEIC